MLKLIQIEFFRLFSIKEMNLTHFTEFYYRFQFKKGPLGPKHLFKKDPKKFLCIAEIRFGQPRQVSNSNPVF